ncbi:uncharacterized protein LOC119190803 [Manduca sexta]|uniref:uncharacterized protein LOC119190803 n=1 Tax=Manduca sexta TaxID=7130 RepID=UPI00188F60D8|nr:uncharacterized protein LOC119190803 [Manduca sexta]
MPKRHKKYSVEYDKDNLPSRNLCVVSKSSSTLYTKKKNVNKKPRKLKDLKNLCYKLTQRIDNIPTKVTIKSNIYSKTHQKRPKMKVTFSLETYKPNYKKECGARNTASDCNLKSKTIINCKKQELNSQSPMNVYYMVGDTAFTNMIKRRATAKHTTRSDQLKEKSTLTQDEPLFETGEISKSSDTTLTSCSNKYHTLKYKYDSMEIRKRFLENNIDRFMEKKSKRKNVTTQKHCPRSKNILCTNTFLNGNNELHTALLSSNFCVTGKKLTLWKKMKVHLNAVRLNQIRSVDHRINGFDERPVEKRRSDNITTNINNCDTHFCVTENNFTPSQVNKKKTCTSQQSTHSTTVKPPICNEFKIIKFPHDYITKENSNKDQIFSLRSKLCVCKKLKKLSERIKRCTCEPCYKKKTIISKAMGLNIKDSNDSKHKDLKTSNIQHESILKQIQVNQKKGGVCLKILDADGKANDVKKGVKIIKPYARKRNAKIQINDDNLKKKKCNIHIFKSGTDRVRTNFQNYIPELSIDKTSYSAADNLQLTRNSGNNCTQPQKVPRKIKSCPCNRVSSTKPNKLILVSPERIDFEVKKDGKYLRILNYDNVKMFKCSKHNEKNNGTCAKNTNKPSEGSKGGLLGSPMMKKCVEYNYNYRKLISTVLSSLVKRKKVCTRNCDLKHDQQQDHSSYCTKYNTSNSRPYANKRKIVCIDKACKISLKSRLMHWYKNFKDVLSDILRDLKKELSLKQIRSKFPDFKAKEVYIMTLPHKPCFIIYTVCPWLYPYFLYFIRRCKQMFQIFIFILAPFVWCPCLMVFECCRFCLCYFC